MFMYVKGTYFKAYLLSILRSKVKRTVLQKNCTLYKVKAITIMLDRA